MTRFKFWGPHPFSTALREVRQTMPRRVDGLLIIAPAALEATHAKAYASISVGSAKFQRSQPRYRQSQASSELI